MRQRGARRSWMCGSALLRVRSLTGGPPVASVDEHGYIRIVDRTKDLIKSGGEWISSVDMENELMGHPSVAEAAVIAVPDEKWSERPLACVVFRPGKTATAEDLRAHLAHTVRTMSYEIRATNHAIPSLHPDTTVRLRR